MHVFINKAITALELASGQQASMYGKQTDPNKLLVKGSSAVIVTRVLTHSWPGASPVFATLVCTVAQATSPCAPIPAASCCIANCCPTLVIAVVVCKPQSSARSSFGKGRPHPAKCQMPMLGPQQRIKDTVASFNLQQKLMLCSDCNRSMCHKPT